MLFETVFAEPAATAANGAAATGGSLISAFALPVIMLVVLYFIMIRPQRKKDKLVKESFLSSPSATKSLQSAVFTAKSPR